MSEYVQLEVYIYKLPGVPYSVKEVKSSLETNYFGRGSGVYYQETNSPLVFVCWKDVHVITVMSSAYSGYFKHTASRNIVNPPSLERFQKVGTNISLP